MELLLHALRLVAAISVAWSAAALLLAAALSALFRAQGRRDARWREFERRRRWLEAAR